MLKKRKQYWKKKRKRKCGNFGPFRSTEKTFVIIIYSSWMSTPDSFMFTHLSALSRRKINEYVSKKKINWWWRTCAHSNFALVYVRISTEMYSNRSLGCVRVWRAFPKHLIKCFKSSSSPLIQFNWHFTFVANYKKAPHRTIRSKSCVAARVIVVAVFFNNK